MKHKSVDEFSVKTLEIGGLGAALQALRLPFGKECWSKIEFEPIDPSYYHGEDADYIFYGYEMGIGIHEHDLPLLSTLVKRGDEHAKVLRGVVVWCEINAPRYWWQECDRYSVGACCLSSNSTMHQQGKGLPEDELIVLKETLVEGTMQKRVWMFSYQTLRRIYFQRKDHRLPQWRMFCDWIKKLPFAEELITIDGRSDNTDK